MAHSEQTLDSRLIFDGKVIRVTLDTVRLGKTATPPCGKVVHHHGGACIMPVTDQGEVLPGAPVSAMPWARKCGSCPPASWRPARTPLRAAKRELEEECGVTADEYIPLGCIYPTVGYDSEKIPHIWIARGLHATRQHLDEDEFLDVHKLPFDQVLQMVLDNTIRDSKTVAAVLRYALMRGQGQ